MNAWETLESQSLWRVLLLLSIRRDAISSRMKTAVLKILAEADLSLGIT